MLRSFSPERFAGVLVEGDDILDVDPVEGDDQPVLEQNRRRRRPAKMVAVQIPPGPEDLRRWRCPRRPSHKCRSARTTARPRSPACRRRNCWWDGRTPARRSRRSAGLEDFAVSGINTEGGHFLAVLGRGGDPNPVLPNDGRRPALAVDRRFPFDVFGFAPGEREVFRFRAAVAPRPAKLRPDVFRMKPGRRQNRRHHKQSRSHSHRRENLLQKTARGMLLTRFRVF